MWLPIPSASHVLRELWDLCGFMSSEATQVKLGRKNLLWTCLTARKADIKAAGLVGCCDAHSQAVYKSAPSQSSLHWTPARANSHSQRHESPTPLSLSPER